MNSPQLIAIRQSNAMRYTDHNYNSRLGVEAEQLFEHALLRGKLGRLRARLTRRGAYLPDLTTAVTGKRIIPHHDPATLSIALEDIRGSENRPMDFDSDFNPLRAHTKERWMSVARARLSDAPLPSVELIRVGDDYYVRDGHHRISVAKALGQAYIDADVTVWNIAASN